MKSSPSASLEPNNRSRSRGYQPPQPVTNDLNNKYYCQKVINPRPGTLADPDIKFPKNHRAYRDPKKLEKARNGTHNQTMYTPPPDAVNAVDNKYYSAPFGFENYVPSNCSIHINFKNPDPPTYADCERGPRHFNKPLLPPTDKRWPWNYDSKSSKNTYISKNADKENFKSEFYANGQPRSPKTHYKEPQIYTAAPPKESYLGIDNFRTFEEWKNQQKLEHFYPDLFDKPHNVYPGRLFGTASGSFDWWKSQPDFDWWNVSNQSRDTWFRNRPVNEKGDGVGSRNPIPSRELIRVPSVDRMLSVRRSRSEHACNEAERRRQGRIQMFSDAAVAEGFTPLVRKYVPSVPRFPLVLNEKKQLMSTFGPFEPLETVRGQVPSGFIGKLIDTHQSVTKTSNSGSNTPSTGHSGYNSSRSSARMSYHSGSSSGRMRHPSAGF